MLRLLITLLVGTAGGLAAHRFRIPGGAFLGAMLAVGIYNVLGFETYMPPQIRVGVQILVGCLLGLSLNRNAFKELRTVIKPALVIIFSLLMCSLTTGFIVYKFCNLDLYTAFPSSSAGGMPELSLLAVSMGGDGPKVAILHLVRLISVIATMPLILHVLEKLLLKGNKSKGEIK